MRQQKDNASCQGSLILKIVPWLREASFLKESTIDLFITRTRVERK